MLFKPFIFAVALFMVIIIGWSYATAQTACGNRATIYSQLTKEYGEVRIGMGLAGPSALYEIWASSESPFTWTMLKVSPNGWTCIMSVGDSWTVFDPSPLLLGQPS